MAVELNILFIIDLQLLLDVLLIFVLSVKSKIQKKVAWNVTNAFKGYLRDVVPLGF